MRLRGVRMLGCSVAELLGLGVRDSRALNRSLESLTTPFVESPSPPTVSCGGRRCRRRMRGALYEISAIYRRWSENARRRANDVLVKRPLIRLRHLLPQLKSAGGEGLSIGGTPENEPLAQPRDRVTPRPRNRARHKSVSPTGLTCATRSAALHFAAPFNARCIGS